MRCTMNVKIEELVEAHLSAIFSTRNFIWNKPRSNPGRRDETPVSTRRLHQNTASKTKIINLL
jgi:hypothetical protein